MTGITVIETGVNVASFSNAWVDFATTFKNYLNGDATPQDIAAATAALSSAATALSTVPGFSQISSVTGVIAGTMGLESDNAALRDALQSNDSLGEAQAVAGLVSDGSAIAAGVAGVVAFVAPKTAPAMAVIGGTASALSLAAATAQKAIGGVGWTEKYLGALSQALEDGAVQELFEFQINLNDNHGNGEICIPGNPTDAFTGSVSQGNSIYVTETGTDSGSVAIYMGGMGLEATSGGSAIQENISGSNVVSSTDNFAIDLANDATATVNGNGNTITLGADASVTFNLSDDNVVLNSVNGKQITIADGSVSVAGYGQVIAGAATGTITAVDNGNQIVHGYNKEGVQTELVSIGVDGSSIDFTFDGQTGVRQEMIVNNSDGSRGIYKFNSAGQQIEEDHYAADGSGTQAFEDPITHGVVQMNQVNSDGSQLDTYYLSGGVTLTKKLNQVGMQTESILQNPDGSSIDDIFIPGRTTVTYETRRNVDGSVETIEFNPSTGMKTDDTVTQPNGAYVETVFYTNSTARHEYLDMAADGSGTDILYDRTTGTRTLESWYGPGGESIAAEEFDPSTGALLGGWGQPGAGGVPLPPVSSVDHQVSQLVQSLAAFAPASSVTASLANTPSENPQILLAMSSH
jgi:hypothetical protein